MYLSQNEVNKVLSLPDLTNEPSHAIGMLIETLGQSLLKNYGQEAGEIRIERGSAIVSLQDNYYALGYPMEAITLSSRYTRYINSHDILRTQMSSTVPAILRKYQKNHLNEKHLYMCPGKVYRRDVRDKTHVGEPHQLDIWYLTPNPKTRKDLLQLVELVIGVIQELKKEKIVWRYSETSHPYTDEGIEVKIYYQGKWLEILECGLVGQSLLKRHNILSHSGLALGLGLDRLLMIIKDIEDIRVLQSTNSQIKKQLTHLGKYQPVSSQPSAKRDISIAVNETVLLEELTEKILKYASPALIEQLESIEIKSETNYETLLPIARERLGMKLGQKNVLLHMTLRSLTGSISKSEAQNMYEEVYHILHENQIGYGRYE